MMGKWIFTCLMAENLGQKKKREIHFGSSVSLKTAINLLYHL